MKEMSWELRSIADQNMLIKKTILDTDPFIGHLSMAARTSYVCSSITNVGSMPKRRIWSIRSILFVDTGTWIFSRCSSRAIASWIRWTGTGNYRSIMPSITTMMSALWCCAMRYLNASYASLCDTLGRGQCIIFDQIYLWSLFVLFISDLLGLFHRIYMMTHILLT